MNVFMMKRARATREARWDATGEGSRGGHIIGHTSSGKPIYNTHGHAAHKEFTPAEHGQAINLHKKKITSLKGKLRRNIDPKKKVEMLKSTLHHTEQVTGHAKAWIPAGAQLMSKQRNRLNSKEKKA